MFSLWWSFEALFYLHLSGCLLVVRLQVKLALNQVEKTITKAIISSVLLQLPTVSSYIPTAALPLSLLASFNFLYALFFGPVVSFTLLCLVAFQWREGKNTPDLYFCVFGVWLTAFAEFIFTSWRKIWVFALPLAFNLSCRMERLFNSSITRKCPPEQRRSRTQAGMQADEAEYLDYLHLSACNICWRTEESRITGTINSSMENLHVL